MVITAQQRQELRNAAMPLMRWLEANCHPHVRIIMDSDTVELVEGLATAGKNETPA